LESKYKSSCEYLYFVSHPLYSFLDQYLLDLNLELFDQSWLWVDIWSGSSSTLLFPFLQDACKAESRKWCILGGATNYELQEEVLKQMAERKAWQEASKKWEKADYRMKKDQLFRRFQVEKEERMLQQCLCKVRKA
jgi:hypothetical protein